MYPSASLLGQHKDESIAGLPIEELIEKADGFAGVFPGAFIVLDMMKRSLELHFICRVINLADAMQSTSTRS